MSESEVEFFISDLDEGSLPQGIVFLTFLTQEVQKYKELLFLVPLLFSLVVGLTADSYSSPSSVPSYAVNSQQFLNNNSVNPNTYKHLVGSEPGDPNSENLPSMGRR